MVLVTLYAIMLICNFLLIFLVFLVSCIATRVSHCHFQMSRSTLTPQQRLEIFKVFTRYDGVPGWIHQRMMEECNKSPLFQASPLTQTNIICETIRKVEDTLDFNDVKPTERTKTATGPDNQILVLAAVATDPYISITKIQEHVPISRSSIHKILKENKFHPYKRQVPHALNEDDPDRRLQFCEKLLKRLDEPCDMYLLFTTCQTDESNFHKDGEVNTQNYRYWSPENPNWMEASKTQSVEKVNVWAGVFGNEITGPIRYEGTLDGEKYLSMLKEVIIPDLKESAERQEIPWEIVNFQQDGAPAHFYSKVRDFLDETFGDR